MKKLRPYARELRDDWRDPAFWREASAFLWRHVLMVPPRRAGWAQRRTGAERFSVGDWDNCSLLDACRSDAFEPVADAGRDLRPRLAAGSDTGGFLASNYPRVATEATADAHAVEHWAVPPYDERKDVHAGSATDTNRSELSP